MSSRGVPRLDELILTARTIATTIVMSVRENSPTNTAFLTHGIRTFQRIEIGIKITKYILVSLGPCKVVDHVRFDVLRKSEKTSSAQFAFNVATEKLVTGSVLQYVTKVSAGPSSHMNWMSPTETT